MKWMLETFKKYNANWGDIKVVMADKDIKECDTVKDVLPTHMLISYSTYIQTRDHW